MTNRKIFSLAYSFREKMDQAKNKNYFANSILEDFPVQCCGVASRLLAEFLYHNGIETLWISSEEFETCETHAWLVVKDDRISVPRLSFCDVPDNMVDLLGLYGGITTESFRKSICYDEQDIENGLIIDITGDQFGEVPVYVGNMDRFHKRFDFVLAYEHEELFDEEYIELYEIIINQQ